MRILRLNFIIILIISFSLSTYARNYKVNIIGNKYIDQEIVLSLINNLSDTIENIDKSKIIEDLNDTGYFENIEVFLEEGSLNIKLNEYPIFKEIHFSKNKRFKDEDLLKIFQKNNQYNIFMKSQKMNLKKLKYSLILMKEKYLKLETLPLMEIVHFQKVNCLIKLNLEKEII